MRMIANLLRDIRDDFSSETDKFVFAATVVIMIAAHGFCFMNLMFSHDSLSFYDMETMEKVRLGRWLYPFIEHRRSFATPWLMGVLSILFVSIAVVLVSKILHFNKYQGLCVGILFGTNVALTSLFCTYVYDADADCLGIMLACLAVYAYEKLPKVVNVVVSALSLVLCLSLYQAYICVSIGLFVLLVIKESIKSSSWKEVGLALWNGVQEVITLVVATIIYIPVMSAVSRHYGLSLSMDYNGAGNLSSLTIGGLIEAIPSVYKYFADSFFVITEINTSMLVKMNWIMVFLLVASLAIYIASHKKFLGSLVLVIPCVLIMPLALNAIQFVSGGMMHHLMIFAYCVMYLLPIVLISEVQCVDCENHFWYNIIDWACKAVNVVIVPIIIVIGFYNIVYANGAYVHKKLVYDNTALHAQTIWEDINNIEGYVEGDTQVVFMGNLYASDIEYKSSVAGRYSGILTGSGGSSISYDATASRYYYGILGRNVNIIFNDPEILQSDEYESMPVYPVEGYCKRIGDRIVVRISE